MGILLGLCAMIAGGGLRGTFQPSDLPGLVEWWSARDCAAYGENRVTEWLGRVDSTSFSGNGTGPFVVSSAIGPLPVLPSPGGGDAIYFNGIDDHFTGGGLIEDPMPEMTLYFVLRSGGEGDRVLLDVEAGPFDLFTDTDCGRLVVEDAEFTSDFGDGMVSGGTIVGISLSPCRQVVMVDGVERANLKAGYTPVALGGFLLLGARATLPEGNAPADFWQGLLGEVLIYSVAHERCQMDMMLEFQRERYGLQ